MNRVLVMAMVAMNLIVLGTAVRVFSAYRSVTRAQAVPLAVTTSARTPGAGSTVGASIGRVDDGSIAPAHDANGGHCDPVRDGTAVPRS